jgi:hypothetical protein
MPASSTRRAAITTVCLLLAALAVLLLTGRSTVALSGTSGGPATGGVGYNAAASTRPYAFSSMLDGKPVRWNPCAPIRWTANLSGAPAGGLDVLKAAVSRVARFTGTRWVYVGPSPTVPTSAALAKRPAASYPPVLIGWTDAARSDLLRGQPRNVLGMTQTKWFGVQLPNGSKVGATRSAVIALDRTDRLPLRGTTSWETVVRHELGHAMGLAHVANNRQLMTTVLPRGIADFQAGDRAGLNKLGRLAGCVTIPGGRA